MTKIIGGKELGAVTAANVENNSIFQDASDNIIKVKDNSGTVGEKSNGIQFKVFSSSKGGTFSGTAGNATFTNLQTVISTI